MGVRGRVPLALIEGAAGFGVFVRNVLTARRSRGLGALCARSVLVLALALGNALMLGISVAWAGAQQYEPLTASVRSALSSAIAEALAPRLTHRDYAERLAYLKWLGIMSDRLKARKPEFSVRRNFLEIVYYEAKRAGLEPELVIALINVESNFRQHAVSSAGARGYTQVMPFWVNLIGDGDVRKLFDTRINIRFGCVILRHYLDMEKGDLYRALGRYNGSLGKPEYPNLVLAAWKRWQAAPQPA